jgi:DNA modification methylase
MSRSLLIQASANAIPLRDESVQCVVTSPPYWGLRQYAGEQRQAWGGEAAHAHEWGVEQPALKPGQVPDSKHQHADAVANGQRAGRGAFCDCGAWFGALGLEPRPSLYVEHMVEVFREVRRVLRKDGTLWLNLGDSYAGSWGAQGHRESSTNAETLSRNQIANHPKVAKQTGTIREEGLKPKDLIGIPWRVAFALQADGWYLRSDIVWSKPNPMPESITDRPTKSHEYVFLLSKSGDATYWTHRDGAGTRSQPAPDYRWYDGRNDGAETAEEPPGWRVETMRRDGKDVKRWTRRNLWDSHDYYYDADAIREPVAESSIQRVSQNGGRPKFEAARARREGGHITGRDTLRADQLVPAGGRNKRSVWTIATKPYAGAHFATYPEDLVEPCILGGSAPTACGTCGAPWERIIEKGEPILQAWSSAGAGQYDDSIQAMRRAGIAEGSTLKHVVPRTTTGWAPTCDHDDPSGRSLVLDPFNGSGTTGAVAVRLGRSYVGLDVSHEYLSEQAIYRVDPIAGARKDARAAAAGEIDEAQGVLL